MPESTKKSAAKKPTTTKKTAATAAKSGSRSTRPAATKTKSAQTVEKTAKAKAAEVATEPHIHYTSQPSKVKTWLSGAGRATARTVVRPKFWMIVGGIVVGVFLLLVLWWQWQRSYVAIVGGQYLPVSMMDDQLRANYGNSGVNSIIQQQLILQEGARQHVKITDKQINDELAKIKTSSGGQASYKSQLQQLGISESLLVNQVKVQLTEEALLKDKIQVSDKEVSDYYDQNKSSIDPNGTTGLDALKDQIKATIKQQKLSDATSDYVNSLQQRTKVETDLSHLSLTFGEFLQQTVWPIPGQIWNFVTGKK